jgi:hypothetical protein
VLKARIPQLRVWRESINPFIRAFCDTVWSSENHDDLSCLVFKRMDQDLESVIEPFFRGSPILPKVVSKAVLSALSALKTLDAVHAGSSHLYFYSYYQLVRCEPQ